MSWEIRYLPEVREDLHSLDGSQRQLIYKALAKVQKNPLPMSEGGCGKPLGNKSGTNLAGFLKVKLRGAGLRIVYQLVRKDDQFLVVVVGAREDDEVYHIADKRIKTHGL